MLQAFQRQRHHWEDAAAMVLALGYIAGFLAAVEVAIARLLFHSVF